MPFSRLLTFRDFAAYGHEFLQLCKSLGILALQPLEKPSIVWR